MYSPFSENITTMVNSRAIRVSGLTRGTKLLLVPLASLRPHQRSASQKSREERNPEIDEDALCNFAD